MKPPVYFEPRPRTKVVNRQTGTHSENWRDSVKEADIFSDHCEQNVLLPVFNVSYVSWSFHRQHGLSNIRKGHTNLGKDLTLLPQGIDDGYDPVKFELFPVTIINAGKVPASRWDGIKCC